MSLFASPVRKELPQTSECEFLSNRNFPPPLREGGESGGRSFRRARRTPAGVADLQLIGVFSSRLKVAIPITARFDAAINKHLRIPRFRRFSPVEIVCPRALYRVVPSDINSSGAYRNRPRWLFRRLWQRLRRVGNANSAADIAPSSGYDSIPLSGSDRGIKTPIVIVVGIAIASNRSHSDGSGSNIPVVGSARSAQYQIGRPRRPRAVADNREG